MGCNPTINKTPTSLAVFAKRKPAFKIRIDSLRAKGAFPLTPTLKKTAKKQKSVRFGGENSVLFRHATDGELRQSWYQSKDYEDFQKDTKNTINALKEAHGNIIFLDANEHCIRGLEAHISSDILRLRQMRIRSTVQMVLDQQKARRLHNVSDPNMISAVSMIFSRQSRNMALSMGALDNSSRWLL